MSKSFFILIFFLVVSSFNIKAQNNFKPNFQIVANGSMSFPFASEGLIPTNSFPGFQIELTYNKSKHWGLNGNFSADYIRPLQPTERVETSHQIVGFVSGRYYITYWKEETARIYSDVGIGFYNFKQGNVTSYINYGPVIMTQSYSGLIQFGINIGFGINKFLSPNLFLSSTVRYHDIFKRSDVEQTISTNISSRSPTQQKITGDIPARQYMQATIGIGYIFK